MSTRISSIFSSVQNSEFPYIVDPSFITKNDGTRLHIIVTSEIVDESEDYEFKLFLEALGVADVVNNYGLATYDSENDVFKNHCPCYFGLDSNGQMGLKIGTTLKHNYVNDDGVNVQAEYSSVFIPCEVEEIEIPHGKKTKKVWEYTLNGVPIDLEQLLDQQGKVIANYLICEDVEGNSYSFPLLIDKSKNLSFEEINEKFKNGTFAEVLRDIDASRIYLSSNKAFVPCFKSKVFPANGVLLLVKNGKIKFTAAGSHPNIKSDIYQSDWEIIGTSHPELLVNYKTKTGWEMASLGECSNISFTSATRNNEGYTWLDAQDQNTYNGVALIHIIRPADNVNHTPVNTLSTLPHLMLKKVKGYPALATKLAGYLAGSDDSSSPEMPVTGADLVRSVQTVNVAQTMNEYGRSNFKTVQEIEKDEELQEFLGELDQNPI